MLEEIVSSVWACALSASRASCLAGIRDPAAEPPTVRWCSALSAAAAVPPADRRTARVRAPAIRRRNARRGGSERRADRDERQGAQGCEARATAAADNGDHGLASRPATSARHDIDLTIDAGFDLEIAIVDLALVACDDDVVALGEHHDGKRADRFLDHVAAGGQHRP